MPEIVSLLHPDQSLIQFGQSEQFLHGLEKAVFVWKHKFNVTASGIRRPYWAEGTDGIKEVIKNETVDFWPYANLFPANKDHPRGDASCGEA
jgi:xeroderma pigmentosum group C-complementing protein